MICKSLSKVLTFCILATAAACVSCFNEDDDVVPWVEVKVRINTLDAKYIDLQSDNGRVVVKDCGYGGNGIIVYHTFDNNFNAFDCTCTYEVSDTCAVVLDEGNIAGAVCPVCGSKFELINCGMPTTGKARHSLKSYRVSYNEPILRIFN